ncbi:polysaccharide pyruvyl transferase family protein [Vibrio sp. PNB23_22_6]
MRKIKALIVPACTDLNRGDQALVWEAAYLIEDSFGKNCEIGIVDYGNSDEDRYKQSEQTRRAGFKVFRNIIENPKRVIKNTGVHDSRWTVLQAGIQALIDFVKHFLLLLLPYEFIFGVFFKKQEYLDSFTFLKDSECIVVKGGGFLHTYGKIGDLYYLWFGLYYLLLGIRLKKKIIFLPNSVGPITGFSNRKLVQFVLSRVDKLYARESISHEYLKSMGVLNSELAFDLGYYSKEKDTVRDEAKNVIAIKNNVKKIGITVRPYRFPHSSDPIERYENYIATIAKYCNKNPDIEFYFIVQVQGPSKHETDLIAINDVISQLDKSIRYKVVDGDFDYKDMMTVYKGLDYLIGTRFHSVIFSQVMGVPSMAIAYGGNKSKGIMEDIHLGEYVVAIEEITFEKLNVMMNNLQNNQAAYKDKLEIATNRINLERNKVIEELRGIIE